MSAALLLLTPARLDVLRALEAADLDVLPIDGAWWITDPEQPAATSLIGCGATLAAALDAAWPVALADGYVTAPDEAAEPGHCGWCSGTGTGASDRHVCRGCGGSGSERVAS